MPGSFEDPLFISPLFAAQGGESPNLSAGVMMCGGLGQTPFPTACFCNAGFLSNIDENSSQLAGRKTNE